MGRYITIDGLKERMTERIFNNMLVDTPSDKRTAAVTNIISRAEDLADAYISKAYTTPVPVNGLVEEWVYRFAEYEMYKKGLSSDVPIKYKQMFDEAKKDLMDVGKGILKIVGATPTPTGASMSIISNTAVFTASAWYGNTNYDGVPKP